MVTLELLGALLLATQDPAHAARRLASGRNGRRIWPWQWLPLACAEQRSRSTWATLGQSGQGQGQGQG